MPRHHRGMDNRTPDEMRKSGQEEARETSRVEAEKTGKEYMPAVGREGIKRQQEGMRETADVVEARRSGNLNVSGGSIPRLIEKTGSDPDYPVKKSWSDAYKPSTATSNEAAKADRQAKTSAKYK